MKKLILLGLYFFITAHSLLHAQFAPQARKDTLPGFSVKNAGYNRIVVGWMNNYPVVKQISIQRSFDSLNNYKTILTVPDPAAIQNGYMDVKATNDHMFYRLYILLDNGNYLFSAAQKPVTDNSQRKFLSTNGRDTFMLNGNLVMVKTDTVMQNGKPVIIRAEPVIIKLDGLKWVDSVAVPNPDYKKPKVVAFTPSLYVFTNRDGYVRIKLPDEEKVKKYSIRFFDNDDTFLFELKDIKEKDFKIDKTNFYHAGWFRFELYENGKLIEKHKFYLEKDF